MEHAWFVWHERVIDDQTMALDHKIIGFFESNLHAQVAIDLLSTRIGFSDHVEGFQLRRIPLNRVLETPALELYEDWSGDAQWQGWESADFDESSWASMWFNGKTLVPLYSKEFFPATSRNDEDTAWLRLIGVFSDYESVRAVTSRRTVLPKSTCFATDLTLLNASQWLDGFVTEYY